MEKHLAPLFFKLLFVIIIAVFMIGMSLDVVRWKIRGEDSLSIEQITTPQAVSLIKALASYQYSTNANRTVKVRDVQLHPTKEVVIRTLAIDDVSLDKETKSEMTANGWLAFDVADEQYYLIPLSHKTLIQVGPIYLQNERYSDSFWTPFLFYGLTSVLLSVILWPFVKELSTIRQKLQTFGRGSMEETIELSTVPWAKDIAHAFNKMAKRIQDLVRSHKELTYGVSHELRTPISRIKFSLALLPESEKIISDTKKHIQNDLLDLEYLIDEMLEYAKFDHGDLVTHPTRVNICPWIEGVVSAINQSARIKVDIAFGAVVRHVTSVFDPNLIKRAVENVIFNALKFALSRILVTVEVRHEQWIIHVEDDGPGIEKDKLSDVFNAFHQIKQEGRKEQKSGVGLGLAIVKRVVLHHHGVVEVGSSRWGGAKFSMYFPIVNPLRTD